jgi:arylsulfatase A-like enzyme
MTGVSRLRRGVVSWGCLLVTLLGSPLLGQATGAPRTPRVSSRIATPADYPFLHRETTPDALGPYFGPTSDGRPPNVVVILVEGLGRSFSGPDAPLGSFTPFLDELAGRSLYFTHFLSNHGRTFGVLPSVFGSLPMAEQGFTALGAAMPGHAGLYSVLKRQGYRTSFYTGTNVEFDDFQTFLRRQSVDDVVDVNTFGPGYQRNPLDEFVFTDRELVTRVLADSPRLKPPFVLSMLTNSMHIEYKFPGQEAYLARVEARLQTLRIPEGQRARYRAQADIYSSILLTDDQLKRYFESVARAPWYANTIFVITGDHRLPEIPQDTYLERFHVPLLIYSPLLRRPERIAAVSSHLDVTPSLLALLSHTYGLQRPAQVTWTGSGLDMGETFRNNHEIPLRLGKTSALDYLSGRWFLHEGQLFEVEDGLRTAEMTDARVQAQVQAQVTQRLQGYLAANARFLRQRTLSPEGDAPGLVPFQSAGAVAAGAASIIAPGLGVDAVRVTIGTDSIRVRVVFVNGDPEPSASFVPLLLLLDEHGRELQEVYGAALRLAARGRRELTVAVPVPAAPGHYLLSILPSDPTNGKPSGQGYYRIDVEIPPASR